METRQYNNPNYPDFEAAEKITLHEYNCLETEIGPQTFEIKLSDPHATQFCIFLDGCAGSKSDKQKAVAKLKDEKAAIYNPCLNFYNGDLMYDYGANSATDPQFKTCFYDIYYSNDTPNLQKIPSLLNRGNHDDNYHAKWRLEGAGAIQGREKGKHQVFHNYTPSLLRTMREKAQLFKNGVINISDLSPWNMPYYFYTFIIGETQFFCADTNAYLREFRDLMKEPNQTVSNNQAAWMKSEYERGKTAGRKLIWLGHAPFEMVDKRVWHPDAWHYVEQKIMGELNEILGIKPPTNSYYDLTKSAVVDSQKMTFDLYIGSHAHFLNWINNKLEENAIPHGPYLGVGGGGGKLSTCESFKRFPYVGCQLQQHGFAMLTTSMDKDKKIELDIFTVKGRHLKFNTESHIAIRQEGDESFETLRSHAIKLGESYIEAKKEEEIYRQQQNASSNHQTLFGYGYNTVKNGFNAISNIYGEVMHRPKSGEIETNAVLDMMAYFNQAKALGFEEACAFLTRTMADLDKIFLMNGKPFQDNLFALKNKLQQPVSQISNGM